MLPRAKDCTDLESAIEKAKAISIHAQIVIWGGLGSRIDHTLGNIYLLLRHPGRLFLESADQKLFAISDKTGVVEVSHASCKTMALIPLTGPVSNVALKNGDEVTALPLLIDKTKPFLFPFHEKCTLSVEAGEVLVILDQRELFPLSSLPQADIPLKFSLQQPLIHIFGYLIHQSLHCKAVKLFSEKESVFNIQPASGFLSFISKRGQTISLIPFYGPAKGVKTQGLKWELGEATVDKLDKEFVGVSNVSMGDQYSVSIKEGELLCIVNENLIDEEMVETKINTNPKK